MTPWWYLAACAGTEDPVFFPRANNPTARARAAEQAREDYCGWCEVTAQCLELADRTFSDGVFGGMSVEERRTARRRRSDAERRAGVGER